MSNRTDKKTIIRTLLRKYRLLVSILAVTFLPIFVIFVNYLRQDAAIIWVSNKGGKVYLEPDRLDRELPGGIRSRIKNLFYYRRAEPVTLATNISRPFVNVVGVALWDEATDDDLRRLSQFRRRTRRICLGEAKITDNGLRHLAKFADLNFLSLQSNKEVTAEGLRQLHGLTELKSIHFGNSMTDEFLEVLPECFPALEVVTINGEITDRGLVHLGRLVHLKELEFFGSDLKGPGLEHLKRLPDLEKLTLDKNKLTDEGLKHVSDFPALRELRIRLEKGITDEGMAFLAGSHSLEELWLSSVPITDEGLAHLAGIFKLKKLVLSRLQITDDGVARFNQRTLGKRLNPEHPWIELYPGKMR